MTGFDRDCESYRDAVNSSIGFSGADVDFFARLKAEDLLATLRRRLGRTDDARVLDVGCGPGVTDTYLAGRVRELHGADVSIEILDAAAAANPQVGYHHYDGAALPFPDASFDATFTICVLHHVEPDKRPGLVWEMRRVTRPGGVVAIYEHNPLNPLTRVAVARCEFDEGVVLLGRGEARRLLAEAGAPPVESRYIAFFPWRPGVFRLVERGIGWLPLGGQYAVVGRVA
jgi:SAM-dependent methyltransferase